MRAKHRDAAAYELGVLDDAGEFEIHLAECPRCRDLLTGFHPVSEALAEAARLGYLPGGGSPPGGPPASGAPALGSPPGPGSPAPDGPTGAGAPAPDGSADAGAPTFGGSPGPGSPASGSASVSGGPPATGDPVPGSTQRRPDAAGVSYPPPSEGSARRRKPWVFSRRRGMVAGVLLLGGTIVCAARPAVARTWSAFAASIVSPAQVVAGTGHDLRDLPWSAGFQ